MEDQNNQTEPRLNHTRDSEWNDYVQFMHLPDFQQEQEYIDDFNGYGTNTYVQYRKDNSKYERPLKRTTALHNDFNSDGRFPCQVRVLFLNDKSKRTRT